MHYNSLINKHKPAMLCDKYLLHYTSLSWEKAPSEADSEDAHVLSQILALHESEINCMFGNLIRVCLSAPGVMHIPSSTKKWMPPISFSTFSASSKIK